jgi:hypothetical protein
MRLAGREPLIRRWAWTRAQPARVLPCSLRGGKYQIAHSFALFGRISTVAVSLVCAWKAPR